MLQSGHCCHKLSIVIVQDIFVLTGKRNTQEMSCMSCLECANSTFERQFRDALEQIDVYPGAKDDLLTRDPRGWCKTFFRRDIKCDANQNNLCEAFNGVDVVLLARQKPIYSLCRDIRKYLIRKFGEKRVLCSKWHGEFGM